MKEINKIINITQGPTNWFFVILVFLAGAGAASFVYISLLFFNISIKETGFNQSFFLKHKAVSLSLTTNQTEYNLNDLIEVNVSLDSGGKKTAGVDVSLNYDPKTLELQTTSQTDASKKAGRLDPLQFLNTEFSSFDIFPYIKLDKGAGALFFSALAKPLREVQGKGVIAAITFKALKSGKAKINLVFEKDATTDSNVAYLGKDILNQVYGLELTIK